ncbi:MAG: CHAT domain-containing protein [Candidatus Omnitrophica bacterium]|nr:CHAT domain-containing protein [Candidatus Omnitrophota bacterium]
MTSQDNCLVLEIFRQTEALKLSIFSQESTLPLRHYSQQKVSFKEISTLSLQITNLLNKIDRNYHLGEESFKVLKKTAQVLWDNLLTPQVKEILKNSRDLHLILSLDEELISLPWELLYDGEDFLCLKFNLGRLVRTKTPLKLQRYREYRLPLKMLILANPTGDLKSAYLEGIQIKRQFDKRRKEIKIDSKTTFIDTLYIKKNLRDYDIVHFAGHCEYDPKELKNSGWVLSDGRLNIESILALGQTMPLPSLVFSNTCHSARIDVDLIAPDYQTQIYGLAEAFLFSGTKHYLGTIRKVEDNASLVFAGEFYRSLLRGLSIGEATRLARRLLVKEYGLTNISWTSYLLYGDPNFVLFKSRTLITKPKKVVALKKPLIALALIIAITSIAIYLYMWLPSLNPNTYLLFVRAKKSFLKGNNPLVISICKQIIQNDPLFLASYPLIADTYFRLGDSETALRYYFDYARFCEKKNNKSQLSEAYREIGWIYLLKGEYQKALDFINQALNLSQEIKDKLNEARALARLAIWYLDRDNNDKALELLMKSSEINRSRQHNQRHLYALACDYFDIALVFTNKDDFSTAKEFYAKSKELFEKLKLKHELSDCYFNLGEIYMFEKQYAHALDYYQKGLEIDRKLGNKFNLASDYNMFGELYVAMDNLKEAENYFHQSISLANQINARPELAQAYYNLGLLYKRQGYKNKARDYLRQAQEIYSALDPSKYAKIKQEILELDK